MIGVGTGTVTALNTAAFPFSLLLRLFQYPPEHDFVFEKSLLFFFCVFFRCYMTKKRMTRHSKE